jgi:alkyldihydroxyacetonephosphate synthase
VKEAGQCTPDWREDVPADGSYRSILKYAPRRFKHPSPAWVDMFKQVFEMTDDDFRTRRPGGDAQVVLRRRSGLSDDQVQGFVNIVGRENVSGNDYDRVKYGHGKSVDENLALRRGIADAVPDLVVHPRDKADVVKIVEYCNAQRIPIVPYSAGSGVVFGNRATNGGIALVLQTHMNKVLAVNELNQTAVVQPGTMGPAYEEALNDAPRRFGTTQRYTCGHFPQSFELSAVGGWILASGSGQASTYYGDACDLVLSAEYVTPAGIIKTRDIPGTATGPKVNDVMKGSEGAYGILVEATMKVFRHMPENRQRFAVIFKSWDEAVGASREIMQGEFGLPAVFRISDPEETEIGLKLKGFNDTVIDRFMRLRGFRPRERCLGIGTAEGERGQAKHVRRMALRIAREHGAMSLTGYATRQWEHGRYSDVHMREDLLDHGIIIDTLETGVTWDNLQRVYEGVRSFAKQRPRTLCTTHCSHFYPQGTNLYFIFMLRPDSEEEFFQFRKQAVDKMVECGGSISHHHGIGRMFAPWMETYLGKPQMDVLRALKRHFDPHNIMNPGGTLGLDAAANPERAPAVVE